MRFEFARFVIISNKRAIGVRERGKMDFRVELWTNSPKRRITKKMDEVLKSLSAQEYHESFLEKTIRSDGRGFDDFRPAVIQANVISSANGSAMIRQGDALIIASISAELGRKANVEVRLEQSSSSDESCAICADSLQNLLENGSIIDWKELEIEKDKLYWILNCDVVVLDGAPSVDGCLMALVAALNSTTLPEVILKPAEDQRIDTISAEEGEKEEDEDDKDEFLFTPERIRVDLKKKRNVKLKETRPVSSTFLFYRSKSDFVILADPSVEEIAALGETGMATIVMGEKRTICGVRMSGNGIAFDDDLMDRCVYLAESRRKLINRLIDEACKK